MNDIAKIIAAVVVLLMVVSPLAADDYATARAKLFAAYQAQDYAAMVAAAEQSLAARPRYPGAQFNLALAHALNDDPGAALRVLWTLSGQGVAFDVDDVDEFAAVRALPDWQDYRRQIDALLQPVGDTHIALQLDSDRFVPEGIAIDDAGNIFLGSIHRGQLVRGDDVLSDRQGHWSVFGMRFDAAGDLWFASAAVPQLLGVGDDRGKTGLFRLDVTTGNITRAAILPKIAEDQVLGDLVIAGDSIYTTDSLAGAVYRYDIRADEFNVIVKPGELGSPQGLVLDESGEFLYVADYIGGLYRVGLDDGSLAKLAIPDDVSDYGIDGLYRHREQLIAIQNGIQPHRVVSFGLDNDGLTVVSGRILAANLETFDEPTLGTIRGDDFYFVANSHWNRFDRENRLPDGLTGPIVLKVRLDTDAGLDSDNQNEYSVLP